ncbi:YeeE/YedE family protein [Alkalibacter rhizosphaerae]|uniref:YeeE/YedE family protein n=1 Tax=Alkalibacter rhizosphaerae TaxID=2815577 RepID=A0A974XFW3_9FIRM|nr:YeeE/YedE family protein [Alkalibacter rhizosphaerae]QSX09104.1 YeeE/YedE family protein [Alkalibacter rhizosphaerae]
MGKNFNKGQATVGFILILAIAAFSLLYWKVNIKFDSVHLVTGVIIGYVLSRSRFGFAGGVKRVYVTGEASLTTALMLMFGITTVAVGAIHYTGLVQFTPFINPVTLGLFLGGFLFGMGMILAGGCASGTLTDSGEGEGGAWIGLIFFILGSVLGVYVKDAITATSIGKAGTGIYLPDYLGIPGAILVSLLGLFAIYWLAKSYENKRKANDAYEKTQFADFEAPIQDDGPFQLFSFKTYHKLFVERWTFITGGILLAFLYVFIVVTSGTQWGVTGVFTSWGVGFLQLLGMEFPGAGFAGAVSDVNNGLVLSSVGMRNVGLILGALAYFLTAGRFKLNFKLKPVDILFYAIGGTLMGVGARLANGCNVGALFSGIVNLSLGGWVFLLTMTLGGLFSLKVFAGKTSTVPIVRCKK